MRYCKRFNGLDRAATVCARSSECPVLSDIVQALARGSETGFTRGPDSGAHGVLYRTIAEECGRFEVMKPERVKRTRSAGRRPMTRKALKREIVEQSRRIYWNTQRC